MDDTIRLLKITKVLFKTKETKGMGKNFTDAFHYVRDGRIDRNVLNSWEWIWLIRDALESSQAFFASMAKDLELQTLAEYLNGELKINSLEKRVTSEEIIEIIPVALFTNNWKLIPVKELGAHQKGGKFFRRELFLVPDLGCLMILDLNFTKEYEAGGSLGKSRLVNENVFSCEAILDSNSLGFGSRGKFTEIILPYLKASDLGIFILDDILDQAVDELRKRMHSVQQDQKSLESALEIRERLGISNLL